MPLSIRHILTIVPLVLSLTISAHPVDSLLEIFDRKPSLKNADAFFAYLYEDGFTDAPRMYRDVPTPPLDTVKALVWYWAGEWYYATQQYPLAEKNLLRALDLMQYADKISYSDNLAMLGLVEMRQSKYEEALRYMQRCYELDMESGDPERICSSLNTIAGTLMAAGDPTEGMKYELRAIEYAKKAGNPARLAVVYGMASEIEHTLRNDEQALCYADSACVMEATTGNTHKMMVRQSQKASILNGLKRYEEAYQILAKVIPYFRQSGDQLSLAISLNKMGIALHGLGKPNEALTHLYEAISICQSIGNMMNEAYAQREVYEILFRDNPDEARTHLLRYHELKDSLYSQATAEQIARFNAEFRVCEYAVENTRLKQRDKMYAIIAIIAAVLITIATTIAVLWYRKRREEMDKQLNALMIKVNSFKAQEAKSVPVETTEVKPDKQLSAAERRFLENIMHTTTQMMPNEAITVEKIAGKLIMTPKTLYRRVMELTGISAKQYLLLIQLEQSQRILVEEPEASILDVAMRCGFENANTFSGAFKRVYNLSPTEFRRQAEG
ncbi:MAG: AraC family transcriptional regulator [Paludibacteraceae bacterium]|nr:AraC family transcriptional regulator [Paludibacteraceae bacterium]